MILGEKLTEYMKENNIPITRLCTDVLKMDVSTVYKIIHDDLYSSEVAKRLADIMGDDYKQFITPNTCYYCGAEFIGKLHYKCCCAKCSRMYRSYGTKKGVVIREVRTRKVKGKAKISLGEMERMAEKKEMSYGQFVGLQKLKEQKEENEKRYKLFILDKKRADELEEEIAKLAKYLSYSPEEIQRIFYDKDIYAINKSKRKKARKAFVKSCIEHSYDNISSMISKAEVELAFVNERIAREEEAFNSYDKLGVWRLEAVINDK